MKFLSDILAKAGLTVDGVVTLNNTATGQTPAANDNSTKLATTAWVRGFVTPYSLPIASSVTLGGVKIGSGLAIDGTGIVSVTTSGVGAIRALQQITATAGQTVFTVSGGYTPGLIDVFLNGVLLTPTAITSTNGTTFTLGDGALVNDLLDIFVYNPIYNGFISTTDQVPEGATNLYYTNARARAAISLTTTGSSGAATYNSSTGVLNIPSYIGGVVSIFGRTGTVVAVSGDYTTTLVTEGTNLYYTDARARASISVTGSGSYDSATGIITVTGGVTSVNTLTGAVTLTTTNIAEGTNLYYTQARFDTAFGNKSTTNLAEGTNLYYTTARANADFDTRLATKSTSNLTEGSNLYYTDARVGTYLTTNSYATQSYVGTQIANLVASAPGTLDTLNELAVALGNDPNFATTVATSIGTKVPQTRTITINGTAYDLSADRSWTIASGVTSFNTRTGAITPTSGDYTTALVTESGNLYFTNARAIASTLTGYTSGAGSVTSADSILSAIQKLNGNISGLTTGVSSVFGRTGAVIAVSGDYTTTLVTEGTNLYYTDARARLALSFVAGSGGYNSTTGVITIPTNNNQITNGANYITLVSLSSTATGLTYTNTTGVFSLTAGYSIPTDASQTTWDSAYTNRITSLTTTGTSGAATLSGNVLNIPQYQGGVTSFNTRTGAITLISSDVTTALTYTPVTNARTLTINGDAYDLTADRTWTIGVSPSARTIQTYTATAAQTTFTVTGGYVVGLVDVFINGVRLTSADFTATNGTTVVLTTGTGVNNIVDVIKYTSAFTASSALRQVTYFTATAGQTSFTVSYTPGLVDVYYNGSKLAASEYTASNGTTIVLANAAVVNDALEVISYAYSVGAFTGLSTTRTLTINGTSYDLSADRTWTLTTSNISEGSNLYYTDTRARAAISLTTTGSSGASTYTSGVINIPTYTLSGLGGQTELNGTGLVRMAGTTVSYDNATYATQSYVTTAVANLVNAAPSTLDTLNELATALGNDANFATTVTTSIGTKQPQLNGTGFVKTSGASITYDNSTYLTTGTASSTYLPLAGGIMVGDIQMGSNQNFSIKFRTASAWDYSLKGINDDFFIRDNPGLNYLALYYNTGGNNRYTSLMGVFNVYASGAATLSGNLTLSSSSSTTDLGGVLIVRGNGSAHSTHYLTTGAANVAKYIQYNASGAAINQINAGGDSYITGGNFGIGISTPQAILDVSHTAGTTNIIRVSNGSGNYRWRIDQNFTMAMTNAAGVDTFSVNTSGAISTNSSITATTATFNVNASSSITLTSAGTNASMIKSGSGDELYLGDNDTWRLRFSSGNILMDNGGRVGIGTSSPEQALHVTDTGSDTVMKLGGGGAARDTNFSIFSQSAGNTVTAIHYNGQMNFYNGKFNITSSGSATLTGALTQNSSDSRLKENIIPINNALSKVEQLTGFTYTWNQLANSLTGFNTSIQEVGLSAQSVQSVLPEAVFPAPFDNEFDPATQSYKSKSGENYLTIQYEKLVPLLIQAMKELKIENDNLKDRLDNNNIN